MDSTISVEINENKQLIITYPDGRVENLGTIGSGNSNVYIGPDKNVPDGFVGLQIDPDGTSYLITDEITATSSNELPNCKAVKNYVASADLKGDKGDPGTSGVYVGSGDMPDGYNVQIDLDGKAIEVLSSDEVQQIIVNELAKRGQLSPEFANTLEECTDTSKLYVLPDGHVYAYMKKVQTNEDKNILPSLEAPFGLSKNTTGLYYGYRPSSASPYYATPNNCNMTGVIPVAVEDCPITLYIRGISSWGTEDDDRISLYGSTGNPSVLKVREALAKEGYCSLEQLGNDDYLLIINKPFLDSVSWTTVTSAVLSFKNTSADQKIIVSREPIESTAVVEYQWGDTGHSFITSDKFDGEIKINVNSNLEFVSSIDECLDPTKLYVLPDNFIYAYTTKTITSNPTNQIDNAVDNNKNPYNDGIGYKNDTRLSLSSGEAGLSGYTVTGFIEVKQGDTIRFANINTSSTSDNVFIVFYNKDFAYVGYLRNEAATSALRSGVCVLDNNLTLTGGELTDTAYFRVSMYTNSNSNYFITVNELLEPTTSTVQDWQKTDHAFIPADYEEDITELKDRTASLEKCVDDIITGTDDTFDYITKEAVRVAGVVKEKQTVGSLTFTAMSDMHIRSNDSGWANNLTSCRDAGLGLAELQKYLKLDCAVMLGDYTVGGAGDTKEQIKEDLTAVRKYMANGIKGIPNIWCTGNHDINYGGDNPKKNTSLKDGDHSRMTEDELYAYLISNNAGTIQDSDNIGRNYGYIDFENQKIRCIYLNTVDSLDYPDLTAANDEASEVTAVQLEWLVNTGLDFTNKTDPSKWGIVIFSHHCLSIFPQVVNVLKSYKEGISGSYNITTNETTKTVTYDFTGLTERAEVICAIHGHNHNFMSKQISDEGYDKITAGNAWLWSIGIPNVDTYRNNDCATYNDEGYAKAFGEFAEDGVTPIYYLKTQEGETKKTTSFCVVTIDRKNRKVYATAYGAGKDRKIDY